MIDRDGDRAEGRRSSVEQESTESSKFDGIGNFGTDASKIGSLLGTIDRYFHGNSSYSTQVHPFDTSSLVPRLSEMKTT